MPSPGCCCLASALTFDLLQCWHLETCACQANTRLLSPEPHPQPQVWAFQIGTPSSLPSTASHVSFCLTFCLSPPWRKPLHHSQACSVDRHAAARCSVCFQTTSWAVPLSTPEHYDFDPILHLSPIVSGPRALSSSTTAKAAAGRGWANQAPSHSEATSHSEALRLFSSEWSGVGLSHLTLFMCLCF